MSFCDYIFLALLVDCVTYSTIPLFFMVPTSKKAKISTYFKQPMSNIGNLTTAFSGIY